MLSVRRSWLLPIVAIFVLLYYYSYSSLRDHATRNAYRPQTPPQIPPQRPPTHEQPPRPEVFPTVHLKVRPPIHPVSSYIPLPSSKAKKIPKIQFDFSKKPESPEAKKKRVDRQKAVTEAFLHAWEGYKFHAFGKDEVLPIKGNSRSTFGGWGATMVDAMDTLWMLGLKDDFEMCVAFVKKLDFTTNTEDSLNVFETTIRYLGGILAAYDISGGKYPILLEKAKELGEILYMVFDTPNRLPVARWNWKLSAEGAPLSVSSQVLIAELGSLSVEFTRLGQLTKDPKYFDAIQRIANHMYEAQNYTRIPGLWPTVVNPQDLSFTYNHFTFSGMADSAYEYLPKEYLLLGGLDDSYKIMYETAIEAAKKYIFFRPLNPKNANILISGNADVQDGEVVTEPQGQHLGCFTGGMVAAAAKMFERPQDLSVARKLVDGCIWSYESMPSGVMPELFMAAPCYIGDDPDQNPINAKSKTDRDCVWSDEKWYKAVAALYGAHEDTKDLTPTETGKYWVKRNSIQKPYTQNIDNRYELRPEAIESVFIMYRITGDASLADSAWRMFQNIEKATRTQIAHAQVNDVRQRDPPKTDKMESFWLAETLKYFWLIFAEPDVMNLDEWVFNTEAHPLRRPLTGERVN